METVSAFLTPGGVTTRWTAPTAATKSTVVSQQMSQLSVCVCVCGFLQIVEGGKCCTNEINTYNMPLFLWWNVCSGQHLVAMVQRPPPQWLCFVNQPLEGSSVEESSSLSCQAIIADIFI